MNNYLLAKPDVEHAYKNAQKFIIPDGLNTFKEMIFDD